MNPLPASHASRSATVFVAFSLLQRVLGFARLLLLLWLLADVPGEYGLLLLSLYVLLLLAPLVTAGVPWSMDRFVVRFEAAGRLTAFLRTTLALVLITAAGACGLLGAFAGVLAPHLFAASGGAGGSGGSGGVESLAMILAANLFITAVFYWCHGVLRGLRRVAAAGWMETIQNVLFTGGVVVALLLIERSARCALAIHAASQLLALPVAAFAVHAHLKKGGRSTRSRDPVDRFLPRVLRYSVWAGLAEFAWPLLAYVPLWVVTMVGGGSEGDVLGAQLRLAGVLTLVGLAVSGAVGPHLSREWEAGRRRSAIRNWAWWTKLTFCGLTLAATVALSQAAWLLKIIPSRFRDAVLFRDMLLYAALAGGHLMAIWRFRLAERTLWLWLSPLIAAVAIGILSAWWVPVYGIRAAAVARWVGLSIGSLPAISLGLGDLSGGRWGSFALVLSPWLLYSSPWIGIPAAAAAVALLLWTDWLSPRPPRPAVESGR